jgi:ABC-type branched-subunit amino acid transport system substrate-binding protein
MDLVEVNKLDTAKSYFSRISSMAPTSYLGQQAANMVRQLETRAYVEAKNIGVVLPMSGPYASIGEQTLRGLQLALGISGSTSKYGIRLIVQDSMSSPEEATKAVDQLIYKDHVMAIIGGLSSKTVTAEATRAQEMGIPFLALAQKPGLTKIGPFIFTNSITPKLQVEHIVSYAVDRLKFKRFAVLYPNDRYGVEFANLFWDEVSRRGGKVTAAQTYPPGETDFKASIRKMVGTYYLEDRYHEYQQLLAEWKKKNKSRRKQPPETLLPPQVNFDALFIPDDPRALGQIAPMLAFNDVTNIYLLGTNLWNSPEFIQRGQNFVEKSVFVDVFLADSPEFTDSQFYKDFRAQYKDRPGSFAIQGFDGGRLILHAMKDSPSNRIDFMRMLATAEKVQGATSVLTMSQDREVDRQLLALTVKKNQIIRLE